MSKRMTNNFSTTTLFHALLSLTALCSTACEVFVGEDPAEANAAGYGDSASLDPQASMAGTWGSTSDDDGWSDPQSQGGTGSPANPSPAQGPSAGGPTMNGPGPSSNGPGGAGGVGGGGGGGGPPANNPPGPAPAGNDPSPLCDGTAERAEEVLTTYCSGCHANPTNARGGFSTVLEVPALLASGKVVANDPDASLIFVRISNGSMPPPGAPQRPDDGDLAALEEWINCGAPDWDDGYVPGGSFSDIDWRLRVVLDDLRSFQSAFDRERMRYIDLSHLANASYSAEQVSVYRDTVTMLINSLSRGRAVVAPEAIGRDGLILRLDLRDYVWEEEDWDLLEEDYPYAVVYDPDSRLFPFDEDTAEQIREETGTEIPIIQADWVISHASRPPLYYDLLDLPDTLQGLEQELGVDIQDNIDTEQVLRSGFAVAGPSRNNRVIERHELDGNGGALWVSYDFATSEDEQNIFANPLDFVEDGGEMIFNLENGLQGYFIADAAGARLDKAPTNVVQDPAARDGAVEAGISCMSCHQTDGILPKDDEVRDLALRAGANAAEIEAVLAIYAPNDVTQRAVAADQDRYRSARASLVTDRVSNGTIHELDGIHLGVLGLDMVAAVLGLPTDDLRRAIDASPQALPPEILTLRTQGGGIQRDAFEDIVGELIEGIGLGEQLLVDESNVQNGFQQDNGEQDNGQQDNGQQDNSEQTSGQQSNGQQSNGQQSNGSGY